jgi:hypothetical protein
LHFRSSGRPAAWGRQRRAQGLGQNVSNIGPTCYQSDILSHTLHLPSSYLIVIFIFIEAFVHRACRRLVIWPAGLGQLPASPSQSPIPRVANTITNTLLTQWPRSGHTLFNTLRAPRDMSEAAKCTRYPSSLLVSSSPATSLLAGISLLACTSLPSLPGTTAL